jgi:hypothetical protein
MPNRGGDRFRSTDIRHDGDHAASARIDDDKLIADNHARLGNLLKVLVALICLAAIVQRLLPALGVSF